MLQSQAPGAGGFLQGVNNDDVAQNFANSLHAMTIFSLNEWCEDGDTINGVRIDKVELCALLLEVKDAEYGDALRVRLHDLTGECWGVYPGVHECPPEILDSIKNNVGKLYLHVYGKWQVLQDEKQFQIYSMRPVKSFNEVTFHGTKVCKSFLRFTNVQEPVPENVNNAAAGANNYPHALADASNLDEDMTPDQQKVVHVIQQLGAGKEDVGADISDILQHPNLNSIDPSEIRKIVGELSDNGILFSTTDDDHFQIALG